jgi:hypothetical protein
MRAQFLPSVIDQWKETAMEQPVRFSVAQLSPEQRARVIAILVQMILRHWSQQGEEKPHERANHENPA